MSIRAFQFLLFVAVISDIAATLLSGFALWRYRRVNGTSPLLRAMALLMWSLCFSNVMILLANAFGYTTGYAWAYWISPMINRRFLWVYWVARAIESASQWAFALYLLGFMQFRARSGGK